MNTRAGTASAELAKLLAAELPEATIIKTAGLDLAVQLRRAAQQARILGVAGGDGTISTAAAIALELGLPLLVIPAGTFNHFAADLGIRSAHDAVAAFRAGGRPGGCGVAGRRSFVNASSTGVYVDLVLARQRIEGTLGRRAAAVVGLIQVLSEHTAPTSWCSTGSIAGCWLYFAGNCRYEPPGWRPPIGRTCPTGGSTSGWSRLGGWPGPAWWPRPRLALSAAPGSTTRGGPTQPTSTR